LESRGTDKKTIIITILNIQLQKNLPRSNKDAGFVSDSEDDPEGHVFNRAVPIKLPALFENNSPVWIQDDDMCRVKSGAASSTSPTR
jgi:hypothetical protein